MRLIKLQAENVYLKPGATGLKQIWNHEGYSGVGGGGPHGLTVMTSPILGQIKSMVLKFFVAPTAAEPSTPWKGKKYKPPSDRFLNTSLIVDYIYSEYPIYPIYSIYR